jgi:glycine betaine/proline transport system permease protein
MEEWFTAYKIPLGRWMKVFVDGVNDVLFEPIDFLKEALNSVVETTSAALLFPPPLVIIGLIGLLAWVIHRRVPLVIFTLASLLLILNQGYWKEAMDTLVLVIYSTAVSIVIGIPIGIAAGHRPWLNETIRPVLDMMQTLPTFVYLIPTLFLFGLGAVPGIFSTVIFALPAPIRMTQLGIASVPTPLKEAGEAFGATPRQMLWKIELPHALPAIMAGVNQCIMLSVSMVVIAALVGASGLGVPVVRALNNVNLPMGFESGLCIVLLAIVLDRVAKRPENKGGH